MKAESTEGTSQQDSRAAFDYAAIARQEESAAILFAALVALVSVALWAGAAVASGRSLSWAAIPVGLAVGITVRVSTTAPNLGVRMLALLLTLLASVGGHFLAVCAARGILPLMVLAHWGPAGQQLLNEQVFAPRSLGFYAVGAVLAFTMPVVGQRKNRYHAR